MDIKRKACDIRIWKKKTFISYTCPVTLPVRRNLHRSLLTVSQTHPHPRFSFVIGETFLTKVAPLYETHFPTQTGNIFMNILCIEYFCPPPPKKTHSRTLLFGNTLLKRGRHFD
jgi:hypothetical protein